VFEQWIRSEFGEDLGNQQCSQFVKHLSLWITPHLLDSWGVSYVKILQTEKQMLLVFPHTYYWGFSTGFGIAEIRYVRGGHWLRDDYQSCLLRNNRCRAAYASEQAIDRSELTPHGKKLRYRLSQTLQTNTDIIFRRNRVYKACQAEVKQKGDRRASWKC
jgi:hypothetical protein